MTEAMWIKNSKIFTENVSFAEVCRSFSKSCSPFLLSGRYMQKHSCRLWRYSGENVCACLQGACGLGETGQVIRPLASNEVNRSSPVSFTHEFQAPRVASGTRG